VRRVTEKWRLKTRFREARSVVEVRSGPEIMASQAAMMPDGALAKRRRGRVGKRIIRSVRTGETRATRRREGP
jgi:hypothetical protein